MKDYSLQLQCPPPELALQRAEASLREFEQSVASSAPLPPNDSPPIRETDDLAATFSCPHVREWLPEELDLTMVKSESRGWMLANPVHAMHLSSQLEPFHRKGPPAQYSPGIDGDDNNNNSPPTLYGREQERREALVTQGMAPLWHPWIEDQPEPPHTKTEAVAVSHESSEPRFEAMAAREERIRRWQTTRAATRSQHAAVGTGQTGSRKRKDVGTGVPSYAETGMLPVRDSPAAAAASSASSTTPTGKVPPGPTLHTTGMIPPKPSPEDPHKDHQDNDSNPWIRLRRPWNHYDEQAWDAKYRQTQERVSVWLEQYKHTRHAVLARSAVRRNARSEEQRRENKSFFPCENTESREHYTCHVCRNYAGDQLMQCLDCSFVGCHVAQGGDSEGPPQQHMIEHMVLKNHTFATTCGPQGKIYCFKCGDFVSHPVFTQEKDRIYLTHELPWMCWKDHPLQRSFNAFRFMRIPDQGIVWRGMAATYPQLVPSEHLESAHLCRWRHSLFHGRTHGIHEDAHQHVKDFIRQQDEKGTDRCKLTAPVGMYNLGNSCYMTAILQCLIHSLPIQSYFLRDVGHHHLSCKIYRDLFEKKASRSACLACEMDKLFLSYFESCHGTWARRLLSVPSTAPTTAESQSNTDDEKQGDKTRGEPLVTSDMLAVAWKCISHIAGYEQRDAHEFLHSFLDVMGKHTRQYRVRVHNTINIPQPNNALLAPFDAAKQDLMKSNFEGTLRSVLVCQKCGNKRVQSEPFMSISLALSKEIQKSATGSSVLGSGETVTIEQCLKHFTMPEVLSDAVECPSCKILTQTVRQHVISRLPRILVLHLKRFDFVENKKLDEFVSFPARGLNMGPYLPHWSEIPRVPKDRVDGLHPLDGDAGESPSIFYNLQSTVNHSGTLQSGHYYANVKVGKTWYHCNDAHVSKAAEADVVSQPAYMLFYSLDIPLT